MKRLAASLSIAIALSCAAAAPARSAPSAFCELRLSDAPAAWVKAREELAAELARAEEELAALEKHEVAVTGYGGKLGEGYEAPVLAVETPSGTLALKLYGKGARELLGPSILIQRALGALGYAPKIRGLLGAAATADVLKRFPRLQEAATAGGQGPFELGVLMDRVDGGWAPKEESLPPGYPQPDEAAVMAQIDRIETALGRLRVRPVDAQALLTRAGHVYLVDFGGYSWIDFDGRGYGIGVSKPRGGPGHPPWWRFGKGAPNHGFMKISLGPLRRVIRQRLGP